MANTKITTNVIADDAITLDKMAGLARGKIIYGDSNGNPAALAVGSNGQVLKSDGTDIAWGTDSSGVALDDISTGDAATTLATSAGNITIDAQGNDTDIIFKGTDGSSDTTFLTLDGSEAGTATFNSGVVVGGDITKGSGEFKIKNTANGQNVGIYTTSSSSELHALKIHSGGNVEVKNGPLTVANGQSVMSTATSWGAGLTIKQTNDDASPAYLSLHKDPASGHSTIADNDYIGFINMRSVDGNGNAHTYVELTGVATNVSHGGETSKLSIGTWGAGTEYSSNLVVSGGQVAINGVPSTYNANARDLVIRSYDGGNVGMTLSCGASNDGFIGFSNGEDTGLHGLIQYDHATDSMHFRTNDVDSRLMIDSSGSVGIGNTNPSGMHSMVNKLVVGSGSGNQGLAIYSGAGSEGAIGFARDIAANSDAYDGLIEYSQADRSMRFGTNAGTERMRLKTGLSIGSATDPGASNLLVAGVIKVGAASPSLAGLVSIQDGNPGVPALFVYNTNADSVGIRSQVNSSASSNYIYYGVNSGGGVWQIRNDGDHQGTDTSIGSISDSRLKKDVTDLTYDIDKFKQYRPIEFNWINPELHKAASGKSRGFLAQEVKALDDYYVDQYDAEGADLSLVDADKKAYSTKFGYKDAMYISVIKQLITRLEAAEAKITALEG